jgi:hypothetical protein
MPHLLEPNDGEIHNWIMDRVRLDEMAFMSGTGEVGNPYMIGNRRQLENIGRYTRANFALRNDIDLRGEEWIPIATFEGVLDGRFFTIYGLTMAEMRVEYAQQSFGLFGYNCGTIRDVNLVGVDIQFVTDHGDNYSFVGGVAGTNEPGGLVVNCHVSGRIGVPRNNSHVGGIVGINISQISSSSYGDDVEGVSEIIGSGDIGGIAGQNFGSISRCKVSDTKIGHYMTQSSRCIGGIAGYESGGEIMNCGVYGSVVQNIGVDSTTNALSYMGKIVGYIEYAKLWYVEVDAAVVLDRGYLSDSQSVYVGTTRFWDWGGYEGEGVYIK